MSAQFLHISLNFKQQIDQEALKKVFDKALDWAHYMPNCWIVYTSSDVNKWYERLQPFAGSHDSILIVKIDPTMKHGKLYRWVWDWLNKTRV